MNNSYTFMEDHEIINHIYKIRQYGYISYLITTFSDDLQYRYQPVFTFYRITLSYLAGLDLWKWHALFITSAAISCTVAFRLLKVTGIHFMLALIAPFFLFIGTQTDVLIRLATTENFGTCLSLLFCYLLVDQKFSPASVYTHLITFMFIALICGCKEIFITLAPVFIAIRLYYLRYVTHENELKSYVYTLLSFAAGILFVIYFIFFYIDKSNESLYAGIDLNFRNVLAVTADFFSNKANLYQYIKETGIYLLVLMVIVLVYSIINKQDHKRISAVIYIGFIFCVCYFLFNHYVLYRVYFGGHYLLPSIIPVVFLSVYTLNQISKQTRLPVAFYATLLLVGLSLKFGQAQGVVQSHVKVSDTIKSIQSALKNEVTETPKLLMIGDDLISGELMSSLSAYLIYTRTITSADYCGYPGNETDFMHVARIKDPKLIGLFRHSFYTRLQATAFKTMPGISQYNAILIIGDNPDKIFKSNTITQHTKQYYRGGKDWYRYILCVI